MTTRGARRPITASRIVSRAAHRRTLARELADFATTADRLDLETLLETYPAEETREVRALLARQYV